MHGAGRRFGAQQVGRPDLHAGCAERHRRRDAVGVSDAAGSDHGNRHRPHDLWHQRERVELAAQVFRQEVAAMPASLEALRDDRVDAVRFQPARFVDGRRRRQDPCAPASHAGQQIVRGQPEVKAHDGGPEVGERLGGLRAEG